MESGMAEALFGTGLITLLVVMCGLGIWGVVTDRLWPQVVLVVFGVLLVSVSIGAALVALWAPVLGGVS